MQELNTTIAFGKFSALSTTAEKIEEAKKLEADTQEFFAKGGEVQELDSFLDKQDAEDKARIKKWGKTLYDEPVRLEKKTKTIEPPSELVGYPEAASILGFKEDSFRTKLARKCFGDVSKVKKGHNVFFYRKEIEGLVPTHHFDKTNKIRKQRTENLDIETIYAIRKLHEEKGYSFQRIGLIFDISSSSARRIALKMSYRNI